MLVEIQFFNDTGKALVVHAGSSRAYLFRDRKAMVDEVLPQSSVYFHVWAAGDHVPFIKVWDGMVFVR